MKKVLVVVVLFVLGCSTSIYAQSKHFWRISYPDMMYMYWNDANKAQLFRLYVDATDQGRPADTVTLHCNNEDIVAVIGGWTECYVNPHKPISFSVTAQNFKNGAAGDAEMPWYFHSK